MTGGKGHTLADHALGALFDHGHDHHDHDHDHDHDFEDTLSGRPLVALGLDIGSSGIQAAFSRVPAEGGAGEPFWLSPVMLTPIGRDGAIDEAALWRIVAGVFERAGIRPDDVDTGAVILTGAAAAGKTAPAIAAHVSEMAGDLVCAVAGDHMEALLAAYGSGAVALSREGGGRRLLLVDIGGATAKLAIVQGGHAEATAALAIGGRLIAIDREDRIVRLDPMGAYHAEAAGFRWSHGDRIAPADLAAVGMRMARRLGDAIAAVLAGGAAPVGAADLLLTDWPRAAGPIDGVLVSGGVAEYVYARETRHFGDLAPALGKGLRAGMDAAGVPLLEPRERIRATALGAASHAMQMSGDTIFLSSHARLLPRRNLPVVRPALDLSGEIDPAALAQAIRAERALLGWADREVAIAVPWRGAPAHARLRALAEGIARGVEDRLALGDALYVMTEGDIARSLGAILRQELALAAEVLVIDGVALRAFDHVDLGRIRLPSGRVPVTIKSLRFGTALAAAG